MAWMVAFPNHSPSSLQLHSLTSRFKYAPAQGSVLIAAVMLSQIPVMLEPLPRRPGHQASRQGHGAYRFGQMAILMISKLLFFRNQILTHLKTKL